MIPYKYNKLFLEVSEELNVSEDLVDKFVIFYYKELRKQLSGLNHTRINVDGLGQFVVKPKSVKKLINKHERSIENSNNYSFSSYFNRKRLESRLEDLHRIQKQIEDIAESKRKFLKEKYNEDSKENMD